MRAAGLLLLALFAVSAGSRRFVEHAVIKRNRLCAVALCADRTPRCEQAPHKGF